MSENFDRVLDIELKVSVVLGRTKIPLKDIFELSKGSLIELDTFEDQEVEIHVNGRKIGYGQVVIVDDNFGVRITRILGEEELAKTLG
ncbi:Flagellar motor switch protein FliN [uncultured Clostridium sp.]|uniref:Flagellar motor switch protein FliN n=1 Tax=Paeniclostridium hominis TaxID=2764329 RepID=A0ABR7K6C3_9FIRM|nr:MULTISPECIES: flagellar motor switch protein FliN [Paeniclostridium]MDU1540483.1 flagellar motor switch protein FliN [Paeniclostridium sordellii]SCI78910.1 Flagellar motor switch protein FliN [uncultured Clostridium sp.]MBC6004636.1 flagellar motor switch protein FliN [Paeniclostridium hominis]MBC8631914.1 flagellar motor switch protein FliN [[Eubacterium] tenue]SCJ06845.1 Flagellar motor switch protein FliN [uncultured Clostridium sp.]